MNICCFSGRVVRDAETRHAQSGTAITSFTIAVDCGFGEHKRTYFIRVKFFKREGLWPHLTKGKPVIVSGELQTEKWTAKDGTEKECFSIIARDIDFQVGDKRQDGQQSTGQPPAQYDANDEMGDCPF